MPAGESNGDGSYSRNVTHPIPGQNEKNNGKANTLKNGKGAVLALEIRSWRSVRVRLLVRNQMVVVCIHATLTIDKKTQPRKNSVAIKIGNITNMTEK